LVAAVLAQRVSQEVEQRGGSSSGEKKYSKELNSVVVSDTKTTGYSDRDGDGELESTNT